MSRTPRNIPESRRRSGTIIRVTHNSDAATIGGPAPPRTSDAHGLGSTTDVSFQQYVEYIEAFERGGPLPPKPTASSKVGTSGQEDVSTARQNRQTGKAYNEEESDDAVSGPDVEKIKTLEGKVANEEHQGKNRDPDTWKTFGQI